MVPAQPSFEDYIGPFTTVNGPYEEEEYPAPEGGWARCEHHDEQLGPGAPRPCSWSVHALTGAVVEGLLVAISYLVLLLDEGHEKLHERAVEPLLRVGVQEAVREDALGLVRPEPNKLLLPDARVSHLSDARALGSDGA
eukprot:5288564-Pyramimonas_sp.AAC.2